MTALPFLFGTGINLSQKMETLHQGIRYLSLKKYSISGCLLLNISVPILPFGSIWRSLSTPYY